METEGNELVLLYEVPEDEYNSWKKAMGFDEDTALSTCELILTEMEYPTETFAEASARLGIGNVNSETVKDWYYQNHIIYV